MDEAAFTALYHQHYSAVLNYSRRHVAPDVAHDIAAATFLVAWRRRDDLPERPLGWLLATARRTCANERRGSARRDQFLEGERQRSSSAPRTSEADIVVERDHVLRCWRRLSPDDQELLAPIAWEGLDLKSAALVIGVRPATAAVRLHRARRRLENALAATDPAEAAAGVVPPVPVSAPRSSLLPDEAR